MAISKDELLWWIEGFGIDRRDLPVAEWLIDGGEEGCGEWTLVVPVRVKDADGKWIVDDDEIRTEEQRLIIAETRAEACQWLAANGVDIASTTRHGMRLHPTDPPFIIVTRIVRDATRTVLHVSRDEILTVDQEHRLEVLPAVRVPTPV